MPRIGKRPKQRCFFRRHWRTKASMVRLFILHRKYSQVGKYLGENGSLVRYHVKKVFDPTFHPKPVGGTSYPKTKLKRSNDAQLMIVVQRYETFYPLAFILTELDFCVSTQVCH